VALIFPAILLWIFFSLPDAAAFSAYKAKLVPIYGYLTHGQRSELVVAARELEMTAWPAGVAADRNYKALESKIESISSFSDEAGRTSTLYALERARSDNRITVALRSKLADIPFLTLFACLLVCLIYLALKLMLLHSRRKRYRIA
jgi:hypothetical protein